MNIFEDLTAMREWRALMIEKKQRIAFVPTMGNLHEGHLSLVDEAKRRGDVVVASIYVNPLQFDRPDDLGRYPRTLKADIEALKAMQVDTLFLPGDDVIYPRGMEQATRVDVPGVTSILCGQHRPGHFVGVATVVAKLFNLVQPHTAVFGQKDFQQLLVVRRLVDDLNFPIEIVGAPTLREVSGLAMSSRNNYLNVQERQQGAVVFETLKTIAARIVAGERDWQALIHSGEQHLSHGGLTPDYFAILCVGDLAEPTNDTPINQLVILTAAGLGSARLIDNLSLIEYLEKYAS